MLVKKNINEVDINKIFSSNKAPYGEQGSYKYYIGYPGGAGFRPLHIIIKKIKLCTNHMNVLADNDKLLKHIEIWNKIDALFNKKFNKRGLYNRPVYNNNNNNNSNNNNKKYIKTKISPYNENFHGNKKLTEDEYYGHSILLLESFCEVKNKHYPATFFDQFFEIHNNNNINKLFNESVQSINWYDDESNN